jgi:Protein of unknown function (DUF3606)
MKATSLLHTPVFDASESETININEDACVNHWLAALECSELQLRLAVAEVGPVAKDVANELGRIV